MDLQTFRKSWFFSSGWPDAAKSSSKVQIIQVCWVGLEVVLCIDGARAHNTLLTPSITGPTAAFSKRAMSLEGR